MNIIIFITNNSSHSSLHIGYKEKYIQQTVNTKFLGLRSDNHIHWKNHTEQMIPKLSEAGKAIRSMVHISKINTLKSIYYACFHSIIKYRTIFWGNSSNSRKIFNSQKQIIRIMAAIQPKTGCRSLFKQLEALPVPRPYMNFIANNNEIFETKPSTHNIKTRNKQHLHTPNVNLFYFQ